MRKRVVLRLSSLGRWILGVITVAAPLSVHAIDSNQVGKIFTVGGTSGMITGNGTLAYFVGTFLNGTIYNKLLWFLTAAAIASVVYGGFAYITSAGDTDKASQAKSIIIYSILGIIVLTGALYLMQIMFNLVQSNGAV